MGACSRNIRSPWTKPRKILAYKLGLDHGAVIKVTLDHDAWDNGSAGEMRRGDAENAACPLGPGRVMAVWVISRPGVATLQHLAEVAERLSSFTPLPLHPLGCFHPYACQDNQRRTLVLDLLHLGQAKGRSGPFSKLVRLTHSTIPARALSGSQFAISAKKAPASTARVWLDPTAEPQMLLSRERWKGAPGSSPCAMTAKVRRDRGDRRPSTRCPPGQADRPTRRSSPRCR